MLEFYLAEHTQALATAVGPLLIAACGLQPRAVSAPFVDCQSSAAVQERQVILQASKIHICYLLCKISNCFFHCSMYM